MPHFDVPKQGLQFKDQLLDGSLETAEAALGHHWLAA